MVKALRSAGSDVKYSEYRFSGHAFWNRAYGEEDLVDWIFAQKKLAKTSNNESN